MRYHLTAGSPVRMGAYPEGDGVNFAVFSAHAEKMELCLFSDDGAIETDRIVLPERTGDIWHGHLEGLAAGVVYGYRAHGAYAPHRGHRFNPNKLLLDPYTRALSGTFSDHPATLGYRHKDAAADMSFDTQDSAPYVAKSVVTDRAMFPTGAERLDTPWEDTFIYEAHVKGLTQQHPKVPEAIRGTYDALASEPMLEHLNKLGVTAIELLPVHAFIDDGFLLKK
ncbi:MAG: glycogen debranching enzyme GlgX, partial [Roseobacter sp.]